MYPQRGTTYYLKQVCWLTVIAILGVALRKSYYLTDLLMDAAILQAQSIHLRNATSGLAEQHTSLQSVLLVVQGLQNNSAIAYDRACSSSLSQFVVSADDTILFVSGFVDQFEDMDETKAKLKREIWAVMADIIWPENEVTRGHQLSQIDAAITLHCHAFLDQKQRVIREVLMLEALLEVAREDYQMAIEQCNSIRELLQTFFPRRPQANGIWAFGKKASHACCRMERMLWDFFEPLLDLPGRP
ncbi:hypothetical protein LTR37_018901 [Vermiconidia calcicola]|uniref:Uncharacterized protein n=1 Tax=Vermiconidia calcicola TaxID=1690605 RepID=A0ACC3MFS5_9PEZI|nr:hypothetical protein LTR37_018901 [Vermiconidia calcicola]